MRQQARGGEVAIPVSAAEQLAISYIKLRMETGVTFILPSHVVHDARRVVGAVSDICHDQLMDAYFAPRGRRAELELGDVVFTVVDGYPERKKVHRHNAGRIETTQIVVRVHAPCGGSGSTPAEWKLERWDLRTWCASTASFARFLGSLLRGDEVVRSMDIRTARKRLPAGVAPPLPLQGVAAARPTPAPACEDALECALVGSSLVTSESEAHVFAQLAQHLDDGELGALDLMQIGDVGVGVMRHLAELGAVDVVEGEFGEVMYKIRPAGIRIGPKDNINKQNEK